MYMKIFRWTSIPQAFPKDNEPSLIQNLDFDSLSCRRRSSFKRLRRILQCKAVRHQRFQINQPLGDKRDRLRIGLHIPELELDVDLTEGGVHEWVGLEVLAPDPDDEDGSSKASRLDASISRWWNLVSGTTHVYGRMNGNLHSSALDNKLSLLT